MNRDEIRSAISANVIFLAAIIVLGYWLGTDSLYETYPWIRQVGYVVGGGVLVYWAIVYLPEGVRYLGRQFGRGIREGKEEGNHNES